MANLGGYGAIDGSASVSGGTTAPGRDFIGTSFKIATAGTASQFKVWCTTALSAFKLKIWRLNGANYDFVGQSQSVALAVGLNTITISAPFAVSVNDLVGGFLVNSSGGIDADASTGNNAPFKTGDNTTSQATAGFTALNGFALCIQVLSVESLSLTPPTNLRVYQRASNGKGSINLAGTYAGVVTNIEYRLVLDATSTPVAGHDWTTLVAGPSGGVFSGTVSIVPAGGWYNAQVRMSNDVSVVSNSTNQIAVGALLAVIGQSQARNLHEIGTSYTQTAVGSQYTASTNIAETLNVWAATVGSGARKLVDTLSSLLGVPIGLIKAGVGSTALTSAGNTGSGYWLNTAAGQVYDKWITAMNAVGGSCEAILWLQGEQDAFQGLVSQAVYSAGLATFVANFNPALAVGYTHSSIPLLIAQTGRDANAGRSDVGYSNIRSAQYDFAAADAQTYLAAPCIDIPLAGDGIHYTETGYQTVATRLAHAYAKILGLTATSPAPIIVGLTTVGSTTTDITIQSGAGTDFTPISAITTFEVDLGAGFVAVSSAVRQDATHIRLTHASGTIVAARYLYGANPVFTGLVLDNSALAWPLYPLVNITLAGTARPILLNDGALIQGRYIQ